MKQRALPPPLDYAPPPSWHRRRITQRVMLVVVVLLSGVICWQLGPRVWRQTRLLYWQNQCMKYQASPDQAVVSLNRSTVAAPWREFYRLFSPPGAQDDSTLFLHERI